MPFSNFMIWWKAIIGLIFIWNVFSPGCLFSQFLYLKITTMTSYIQLLQHNIQDYKQLHKLFSEIFLYWNYSCILRKIKLDLLVYAILKSLLGCMIIGNNEEGKVSIDCPTDNDCPVFEKLQLLYPGLIWGSA